MRIMLVHPGPRVAWGPEHVGLESLAAMVPDCDVRLVDMRFELRPFKRLVGAFRPHLVGVTACTSQVYRARRLLRQAKAAAPQAFTVVGGVHASLLPEDFDLPEVDAVCIGMGEDTFRGLVECLDRRGDLRAVDGLALRNQGRLLRNRPRAFPASLDGYPPPKRDYRSRVHGGTLAALFDKSRTFVSTSRGCPHRCTFCSLWKQMGERYISRSPEKVVAELAEIPTRVIHFAEANPFGDLERIGQLADRLAEARLAKTFVMDVRSSTVVSHPELIARWRRVGLEHAPVGLEFVDDARLAAADKKISVTKHERALSILAELGIKVTGHFQIDPDFDRDDFERLGDFIEAHDIYWPLVGMTTPLPGTPLLEQRAARLLTDNYELFDLRHLVTDTRLEREQFWREVFRLQRRVNRKMAARASRPVELGFRLGFELYALGRRNGHHLPRAPERDTALSRLLQRN